jgi:ketosteroid isomerase-like protein
MSTVRDPKLLNATFARLVNESDLDALVALYEPDAVHVNDRSPTPERGSEEIARALKALCSLPGRMESRNNFCLVIGELALLRADWRIIGRGDAILAEGSSMEIARRQPDGSWRMVADHATGASLPRISSD